jgi:hypothetical protein
MAVFRGLLWGAPALWWRMFFSRSRSRFSFEPSAPVYLEAMMAKQITCCQCNEVFWIQDETWAVLKRSSQTFHCPFGHDLHYPQGKTEAEKLREQLEAERRSRQRAEQRVAEARDDAEHQRRRANGYKGHATRITKRAKAGVCPCCNRSFENLRRHMATKHPQFTPMPLEVIDGGKADAA